MTTALKMFFNDMPDSIPVPQEFQHKQVELILLTENKELKEDLWEPDFFTQTYGSIPDMQRGEQGSLPERETW